MGDQQVDGFTLVKHSFISKLWMIGSLLRLNIEAGPQTERSFGHSARRSFIGKPCLVGQSVLWISHKRDIFWLVVWNILYIFHILGMSSSQLTFIFFRGVETTTIIHFKNGHGLIIIAFPGISWRSSSGSRIWTVELTRSKKTSHHICSMRIDRHSNLN